ncbi:hypothetical protein BDQ17DRAFT_1435810 [Cyathus striatus]|nr:hypothetical protein BDQ17DRAFT_1435810 [Cyathus striatus]
MSTQHVLQHQPKVAPTFVGIYGAQMIAAIINSILFGVGIFVGMQYLKRYGMTDPIIVKGTVCLLMLLATLETIFTNHQTYANFILSFGDVADLNNIVFSVPYVFPITHISDYILKILPVSNYLYRTTFLLGMHMDRSSLGPRYRYLVIPVLLLSVMQFIAGMIQVAIMIEAGTFRKIREKRNDAMPIIIAVQGGGTAACDVLITIILVYIFHGTNTNAHRTKSLLDKLFTYALNRAAATSFCALMTVFLFYYISGTYYFIIPALASTHLNVISIVSLISSRSSLRDKINSSISLSTKKDTSLNIRVLWRTQILVLEMWERESRDLRWRKGIKRVVRWEGSGMWVRRRQGGT